MIRELVPLGFHLARCDCGLVFSRVVGSLLLHLRLHLDTSLRGARRPGWPPLQPSAGHGIFCSTVSPPRCRPHQANARHKAESTWHLGLASRGEGGFRGRNPPMQQRKFLVCPPGCSCSRDHASRSGTRQASQLSVFTIARCFATRAGPPQQYGSLCFTIFHKMVARRLITATSAILLPRRALIF